MTDTKIFSAVNVMIQVDRMHKQLLDSTVSYIGLHRTHHRILMHIARNKRLNSQKSLAEHIGVTPAAITGALKKLESVGYIKRVQGNDNRFNEVVITDAGKKIVEDTRILFLEVDTSLFDGFTDEELDGYITYLEKIKNNIKKQIANSGEVRSNIT
ncbi:MAG: MarR family transcriptional regulator [Clostridia bacterium]|nr:MarR family transcriptional regulator [Clostridia bacterium]